jgi:hypothetical protein
LKGTGILDFDAMIERNNRGEVRVLLTALFAMALLVVASVVIAVNDVTASTARQDDAATLAPAPGNRAAPTVLD